MTNAAPSPASPSLPTPGSILAGKYRVEKIIGQGGMGVVVEARHIALDERVALKFLLPEYAQHPEAATRFLREARAAVKIKSEHVARVSDVGTLDTGAPYMVMEFLDGSDLSGVLEKSGPMAISDAIDYLIQGCEAIAEAHSHGIIHRDLKPANLFLSRRPDGSPIVKVLDFGISKMTGQGVDNLTRTTAAMGSALYMSPEQMQQTRAVDHRTDIYALGVALYELLAGKQPFYADTLPQLCAEILTGTPTPLRALRPDVPDELAHAIERAYVRDRGQRYQSIAEMVVGLAPWAPPRSQPTIDRVARMGGLAPVQAGSAAQRASGPPANGARAPGTQLMQQGYPVQAPHAAYAAQGGPGTVALPAMHPQAQVPQQPPPAPPPPTAQLPVPPGVTPPANVIPVQNAQQVVVQPYTGPSSARAAANFASGAKPGGAGKTIALVLGAVALLAVGGGIAAFALKGSPQATTAQPPNTADTATVQPPPTSTANAASNPPANTAAPPTTAVAQVPVAGSSTASAGPAVKPPPAKSATAKPAVAPAKTPDPGLLTPPPM